MKLSYLKLIALTAIMGMSFASCSDFLDKPTEDQYVGDNYYQTDEQCYAGINYLYNSPWYDFLRGYFEVGEVLSGNLYMGSSAYLTFTLNGTDEDLVNMSNSLWSEIGASTQSSNVFGLDNGRYPSPTTYSFGLNVTF